MDAVFRKEFDSLTESLEEVATEFFDDPDTGDLEEAYRLMHTLKGNCYTTGYDGMGTLVHKFEDLLGMYQEKDRSPEPELGDLMLEVHDELHRLASDDPTGAPAEELLDSIKNRLNESDDEDSAEPHASANDQEPEASPTGDQTASEAADIQEIPVPIDQLDELFRRSENIRARLLDIGEPELMQEAGSISRSLLDIRLIRASTILPKLRRLIRTTVRELPDKEVDFVIEGEDTQASASVIEDLSGILPHILKNALDHGIETTSQREETGKSPAGTLKLSFEQVASSFVVRVEDDGGGMDPDAIADRAVEQDVISSSDRGQLTRYEKLQLIFEPGFSTAEGVSEVSGRGIGMNAVAETVRRYGGRVEIDSSMNEGSTFELHFPVPFQWDEFLLVKLGRRKTGFPVRYVREVRCLDEASPPDSGMIEVDGQPLPLIGFEELDPRFGDSIRRPVVVLDLTMPVAVAVDALLGFSGTLILSPPSETREAYVSGIGRDSSGENFWGINLKEVSRDVNSYMVGMQ